jgi:hypothetical protein
VGFQIRKQGGLEVFMLWNQFYGTCREEKWKKGDGMERGLVMKEVDAFLIVFSPFWMLFLGR